MLTKSFFNLKNIAFAIAAAFVASALLVWGIAYAANTQSIALDTDNNEYLFLSDENQTGLNITGDFTIEAWVKPASLNDGTVVSKVDEFGDGFAYIFNVRPSPSEGHLYIGYSDESGVTQVVTDSPAVSVDTWSHIAASCIVATQSCSFYVNGSLASSTLASADADSVQDVPAPFLVGANFINGNPEKAFDGLIDDVRVWNVARTGSEIANNRLTELTGSETGLVGYWKLNNGFSDSTGNGNTLTDPNGSIFDSDVPFGGITVPSINSFTATPGTITSGENSTLAWSVSDATLVSIDQGIGTVASTSSTIVSPTTTTTYTITASNQGLATTTDMVTVTVNAAPLIPAVRKSTDESVTANITLQPDDELAVDVEAGKTYTIEGTIFASSTNATPDIRIAFTAPVGSDFDIGHISAVGTQVDGGTLEISGASSVRIQIPAGPVTPIMIKGTIVAGATGTLTLNWAQFASNANAVVVREGSYLKVEEI